MKTNAADYMGYLLDGLEFWKKDSQIIPLYHPLGFVSCVIPHMDRTVKLRLHYWPQEGRRFKNPNWPVHTHNYRLSSLVLSGIICDKQYSVLKSNDGDSCLYAVEYSGEDSMIKDTGEKCSSELVSELSWTAGQQYSVDRGVFHQSFVELNASAVTFVCLTEKGNEPPLVIGQETGNRYSYDRGNYPSDVFWSCVEDGLLTFNSLKGVDQ